jgi:hypothetical protein
MCTVRLQTLSNCLSRYWINQLYEAVNPAYNRLGAPSNFDPTFIPEFHRGIQVAKDWVRELAYTLDFKPQIPYLTNLIRGASLAFEFDQKQASSYMFRSRSLTSPNKPPEYLRRPENEFTIEELMVSLEGSRDWSIPAGILFIRSEPSSVMVTSDLTSLRHIGISSSASCIST